MYATGNIAGHEALAAGVFQNCSHHADCTSSHTASSAGRSTASGSFFLRGFSGGNIPLKGFNVGQLEGFSLPVAE
jgi:hypothetical protein